MAAQQQALIFDCDGVLADTERDGHLPAFNDAFEQLALPFKWTEQQYGELVKIGGGKERIRHYFVSQGAELAAVRPDCTPGSSAFEQLVTELHARKSNAFQNRVLAGTMPPRPGVAALLTEALGAGWKVAIASTSRPDSVTAVLRTVIPDLWQQVPVFAGDMVSRKKPDPQIYQLALRELAVDAVNTLVVEDTAVGLAAARGAGIRTVVTVSSYSRGENFSGASLVLADLGQAPVCAQVLENSAGLADFDFFRLPQARELLSF